MTGRNCNITPFLPFPSLSSPLHPILNSLPNQSLTSPPPHTTDQETAKIKSLPWSLSKGLKTFLPVSDFIPFASIPDPHNATLYLSVNGVPRQNDSTSLMLFDIPRLISHITSVMPLDEDDLILTGTPKGVGRVLPGDVMTAGISVDGKEVEEGRITVPVEFRLSGYVSYSNTTKWAKPPQPKKERKK